MRDSTKAFLGNQFTSFLASSVGPAFYSVHRSLERADELHLPGHEHLGLLLFQGIAAKLGHVIAIGGGNIAVLEAIGKLFVFLLSHSQLIGDEYPEFFEL